MTQNKCTDCAVQQGYKPAEAVHQITEPLRLQSLEECRVMNLETIARLDSLNELQAVRIAELEAELATLKAAPAAPAAELQRMTAGRACYFMERFLKEEKLLGPNEQAALHFVISMLAAPAAQEVEPDDVDLPDVEDMDHSAVQGALSYGVSHNVFHRWMRSVMDKTIAALRATPPAQTVLDWNWVARLLDGRPLVRDGMGFGEHPEIPALDEGMKPRAFFGALGIELKHTIAEDDLELDAHEAMNEAGNWSDWTPTAPVGDGWKLVAIFDTEDGPAAWWMREANAAPQAQDVQDAVRYRWLRDESWACYNIAKKKPEVALIACVRDGAGNVKTILAEEAMDAAIDAAIAASAKGGEA